MVGPSAPYFRCIIGLGSGRIQFWSLNMHTCIVLVWPGTYTHTAPEVGLAPLAVCLPCAAETTGPGPADGLRAARSGSGPAAVPVRAAWTQQPHPRQASRVKIDSQNPPNQHEITARITIKLTSVPPLCHSDKSCHLRSHCRLRS